MEHLIIYIMLAHWLADFVCQTSWMATNKSKNWLALASHVGVYSLVLMYMTLMMSLHYESAPVDVLKFGFINGFCHFWVDAVTSRITKYLWTKGDVHNFFVIIGFDQFIHFAILYGTMRVYL